MTIHRSLYYVVWSLVAALAGHWLLSGRTERGHVMAAALEITPHTVVLKETLALADGTTQNGAVTVRALRKDGSTAERFEYLRTGLATNTAKRKITMATGQYVIVDDLRGLRSTMRRKNYTPQGELRYPGSDCLDTFQGRPASQNQVVLGHEVINGYRVVRVSVSGGVLWFAPDLTCAKLMNRHDLGNQSSETRAVHIVPVDPDESLFLVPSKFREVKLSEMYRLDPQSAAGERHDQYYFANQ
jgi:hypothetical protein